MADDEQRSLYIFGRDISKIPCVRTAILYGVGGSVGCGLVAFLFTSRATYSIKTAAISYAVISNVYWLGCRYNYSVTEAKQRELRDSLALLPRLKEKDEIHVAEVASPTKL